MAVLGAVGDSEVVGDADGHQTISTPIFMAAALTLFQAPPSGASSKMWCLFVYCVVIGFTALSTVSVR